jgi:hypothetical protein
MQKKHATARRDHWTGHPAAHAISRISLWTTGACIWSLGIIVIIFNGVMAAAGTSWQFENAVIGMEVLLGFSLLVSFMTYLVSRDLDREPWLRPWLNWVSILILALEVVLILTNAPFLVQGGFVTYYAEHLGPLAPDLTSTLAALLSVLGIAWALGLIGAVLGVIMRRSKEGVMLLVLSILLFAVDIFYLLRG